MKAINYQICRRSVATFCILILFSSFSPDPNKRELTCSSGNFFLTDNISLSGIVSSFISPPMVYYFTDEDWNGDSGILLVNSINSETGIKSSFTLQIPPSIVINEIPKIAFNNDYLILTDDEYFSLYRFKKSGTQFKFANKITLPSKCIGKKVKYLGNNKFLLYFFYNFHPSDNTYNSNLGVYDAEEDSILKFIHPEMPCIGFSHFPNVWLTVTDNSIALASPCGYKIDFFDFDLNLTGSINHLTSDIKNYHSIEEIPIETSPSKINPKILIDKLLILKDTISRIEKIFFLNETTLLVSSTGKDLGNTYRRIDLWDSRHLIHPIFCNEKNKVELKETDTLIPDQLPLPINNSVNIEIKDNIIYTLNSDDYKSVGKIKLSDYLNLKNEYYEKNDPKYSIQQYMLPRISLH